MPFPDGTATAAEIDTQLRRLLAVFRPPVPASDERYLAMCREYVVVLQRFPPRSIERAVSEIIQTRTERDWPKPGELVAAIGRLTEGGNSVPRAPLAADFRQVLNARAEALSQARRGLIEDFQRNNRELYRTAETEGWQGLLETAVKRAANILSQRNRSRDEGKSVRDEAWPHIGFRDGYEQIIILPEDIAHFRRLNTPNPQPVKKARGFASLTAATEKALGTLAGEYPEPVAEIPLV